MITETKKSKRSLLERYVSFVVDHPCVVMMLVLLMTVAMLVIAFTVKPMYMSDGVYEPRDVYESRMYDTVSMLAVEDDGNEYVAKIDPLQSKKYDFFSMMLFYKVEDWAAAEYNGGVFMPKYLDFVANSNNAILNMDSFNDYCWKPTGAGCVPAITPVEIFKDNITHEYINVVDQLHTLSQPEFLDGGEMPFGFFVDNKFSQSYPTSRLTRTFIPLGFPLNGYTYGGRGEIDTSEDFIKQQTKQNEWFMEDVLPKLEDLIDEGHDIGLDLVFFQSGYFMQVIMEMANHDMLLVVGGMVVIFVCIFLHCKSTFLAMCGVFTLFFSFPTSYFMYVIGFGFDIFTLMDILSLFIVLGIGADNLFVTYDAWIQTDAAGDQVNKSLYNKAYYAYKRSTGAILVTSTTTFFAFISTAMSPIPSISGFGIFSSLMVFFCVSFTFTWFFAAMMFYVKCIQYKCCTKTALPVWHPKYTAPTVQEMAQLAPGGPDTPVTEKPSDVEAVQAKPSEELDPSKLNKIEKFYYYKYTPAIYKARYYILGVSLILLIFFAYETSLLKQGTENPDPLPKDSLVGKARNYLQGSFRASGSVAVEVVLTWGVSDIDRTGVDPNDYDNMGKVVFDNNFKFETVKDQNDMYELITRLVARNDLVPGSIDYSIIGAFRSWRVNNSKTETTSNTTELVEDLYYFTKNIWHKPHEIGFYRDDAGVRHVKWITIPFNSSMTANDAVKSIEKKYAEYKDLIHKWKTDVSPSSGMSDVVLTCGAFVWMIAIDAVFYTAIQNVFSSLLVAFVILTLSGGNILASTYAIATVGMVVLTVFASFQALGWTLGFMESLCVTVMVGISVDYIAHIANGYCYAQGADRFEKMRHSMSTLMISIINSCITTFGAVFFLLFTIITVFPMFGLFVSCAIGSSFVYVHTTFPALMSCIGPIGNQGNLVEMFKQRTIFPSK